MARPFSSADVKRIIEEHRNSLEKNLQSSHYDTSWGFPSMLGTLLHALSRKKEDAVSVLFFMLEAS